jgi:type IV pilus assembly protein PilC
LSRLAMTLESLISAGVNIVEAWDIAAAASGSPALRRAVETWKPELEAGQTPAELVRATSVFPEMFTNLYHSGEISGKLDETLRRLHVFYQEDGTHKLRIVAQWAPRGVYLLVVIFVAYKIIGFWTGYYQNISNITGGF